MGPDELPPRSLIKEQAPRLPAEDQKEVLEIPQLPEVQPIVPAEPVKLDTNVITVKDMVGRVHLKIDEFSEQIDEEFVKEMEAQLKAKKNGQCYFICRNRYWDLYLQKLFAQMISVKIWIIALITILLKLALITNVQFASILGIIMALKGAFSVADVWKKNGNGSDDMIDKV
jgi:hypothetical protein